MAQDTGGASVAWRIDAFRDGDESDLVHWLNDAEVQRYTLRLPFPYTQEDARGWIRHCTSPGDDAVGATQFAIRDPGDRVIGGIGFEQVEPGHRAEIGYWLARPYWSKGIMTAAVHEACAEAIERWKLVRVVAFVFVGNEASVRVLEKNGFALEGLLRKERRKHGRFLDSLLFASLVACDRSGR